MARFLSHEWFDEVEGQSVALDDATRSDPSSTETLILRQIVRGTPDGDIRYHVVVAAGGARITPPGRDPGPADLTITTDWETAAAIAEGELAAQAALVAGRLRIKGNLSTVGRHTPGLAGLDPLPPEVRERTTY